jgi:hypothetical protein
MEFGNTEVTAALVKCRLRGMVVIKDRWRSAKDGNPAGTK